MMTRRKTTPADDAGELETVKKLMAATRARHAEYEKERDALAGLTETQKSRALATIAGATPSEIAKAENKSPQAIAQAVAKPAIRLALREMLDTMVVSETDSKGAVTHRTFQQVALETLILAMSAKKVYTFGSDFVERADWPTRIAAANRVLSLYETPAPIATTPETPVAEEVAETSTTTTHRAMRRRTR